MQQHGTSSCATQPAAACSALARRSSSRRLDFKDDCAEQQGSRGGAPTPKRRALVGLVRTNWCEQMARTKPRNGLARRPREPVRHTLPASAGAAQPSARFNRFRQRRSSRTRAQSGSLPSLRAGRPRRWRCGTNATRRSRPLRGPRTCRGDGVLALGSARRRPRCGLWQGRELTLALPSNCTSLPRPGTCRPHRRACAPSVVATRSASEPQHRRGERSCSSRGALPRCD